MMKKLSALIVALLLILVVFSNQPARGAEYAVNLQGYSYPSRDGVAQWTNGNVVYGNITSIEIDDEDPETGMADDALNEKYGREGKEKDDFSWDATPTGEPSGWNTAPETKGENIMYVAQYHNREKDTNYTWCSNWHAVDQSTPSRIDEHHVKYELIPKPRLNTNLKDPVGHTWMNISIPHFKYTDYNLTTEKPNRYGTFDLFQSYAVFMKEEKGEKWRYLGNSRQDPRSPQEDPPIWANDNQTDPKKVDTGADYFNATGLDSGKSYSFLVRANFVTKDNNELGPVWGYRGGLGDKTKSTNSLEGTKGSAGGSITTHASSGKGDWIITDDDSTSPTVNINSPNNGEDISSTSVTIEWTGSDGESGIDCYYIQKDSGGWTYKGTSTSHTYSSLTQGTHTVDVKAYDNAGNTNTDSVSFEVDTVAPTVSIDNPSEGETVEDNDVTVEWSGSDSGSGIDYYYIRKDSGSWTYKGMDTTHTYSDLSRDSHTVDVLAYDNAGNSETDSVNFEVDPTVHLSLATSTQSDGWNFVSTALIPDDKDLVSILEDPVDGISGSYSSVMYYNSTAEEWMTYSPDRDNHFNDDIKWDRTKGIWIQMTADDTLSINGTEPICTNITLNPGWNMVGYPSETERGAENTLPSEVTKIAVFNKGKEYNIEYIYDLASYTMKAGEGYWVYNEKDYSVDWEIWH